LTITIQKKLLLPLGQKTKNKIKNPDVALTNKNSKKNYLLLKKISENLKKLIYKK
jgi:hypothetical protein